MFFLVFWTAYVPLCLIVLSLVGEWLKQSFREFRAHASVTYSDWPRKRRGTIGPSVLR